MNARRSILGASIGVLLLAPAPAEKHDAGVESPGSGPSSVHTCVEQQGPASASVSVDRLGAAYAPQESGSTDTARVAAPADLEESTLWLARAIYSETKLPHEQELVAWVVRNRVETAYRGRRTYRAVVLDPYQFSAFNPGAAKRARYLRLQPEAPLPRWRQALWVARYVRHAEGRAYRPFPVETRHFYSERSMRGRAVPYWAERGGFVAPDPGRYAVDERRFRFFKQAS
jgi:Cell Wall Hydrolase.